MDQRDMFVLWCLAFVAFVIATAGWWIRLALLIGYIIVIVSVKMLELTGVII